jgi:uncharacterized protein
MRRLGWRTTCLTILALAPATEAHPQSRAQEEASLPRGVEIIRGVRVPMRDGIYLNGTVFLSRQRQGPVPVILTLSPYVPAERNFSEGVYFARSGFAWVAVDSRGRGDSEGTFVPFENDAADGFDTVEWLSRQPWSNGAVGIWGRSYNAFVGWATLKGSPPHLKSIFAAAPGLPGFDAPWFRNNIGNLAILRWLTLVGGRTANWAAFDNDEEGWRDRFEAMYAAQLPYARYDSVMGVSHPIWRKWLQHPEPDEYYDGLSPTPEEYRTIAIPILTVAGHFTLDGNAPGALEYYRRHMLYGSPAVTPLHYLVKGPWDHAGTTLDTVAYDMRRLAREWFDWTLRNGPRPPLLKDRVNYRTGPGDAVWQHAPSLETMVAKPLTLYLTAPDSQAGTPPRAGALAARPGEFVGPLVLTNNPFDRGRQSTSTAQASTARYFETDPLESPQELVGEVPVTLWLSLDVPDTDLEVQLSEVRPDGSIRWQSIDWLRARYRKSLRKAELVQAGQIEEYRFTIPLLARNIAAGSKLRIRIGAPALPQLNYNGGGAVAFESGRNGRIAHVSLHLGARYPSRVELPLRTVR